MDDPDYSLAPRTWPRTNARAAGSRLAPASRCAPAGTRTWPRRGSATRTRPAPCASRLRPDVAPLQLERGVAGVAVDTLSLDPLRDFALHLAWLGAGRWGLECAANLGALPPTGATIVVGRRGSRAAPAGRAAGRAARWRSCDARPTVRDSARPSPLKISPSAAPASAPSAAVNIAAGVVR